MKGVFQYYIVDCMFCIDGNFVWYFGNLLLFDCMKGGMMLGDFWFDLGKWIYLLEGSVQVLFLMFINDGVLDMGFYYIGDGMFGVMCNSVLQVLFMLGGIMFQMFVQGQMFLVGDCLMWFVMMEWVVVVIVLVVIGMVVFELCMIVCVGFLKFNGVLLKCVDYFVFWVYVQVSGVFFIEMDWVVGWFGMFLIGDGMMIFCIFELCGEFVCCWDDICGVDLNCGFGVLQNFVNVWYVYGVFVVVSGDYVYLVWIDV